MRRALLVVAAVLACAAHAAVGGCGGPAKPPSRGVLERDVGGWSFRRYQRLLDVEVYVAGNPAIAHGASYARRDAEKRGRLTAGDVASAVVTRYRGHAGVARALVRFVRRLARDASYRVEERDVGGVRHLLVTGGGEAWAMWVAARHVVKVGGPGRDDVPEELIAAYGERYRSRLEPGALEGPLPPGPDEPIAPPAGKKPQPTDDVAGGEPDPDWQRDGERAPLPGQ